MLKSLSALWVWNFQGFLRKEGVPNPCIWVEKHCFDDNKEWKKIINYSFKLLSLLTVEEFTKNNKYLEKLCPKFAPV